MGLKQDLHYLTVTWRGKNSRWAPKKNWKKNTPTYDKNSPESGHRGNTLQHNKGHI